MSDLNILHKFSPDFLDFSEVSGVTEELICRDAEETGELTREVPFGKDFPESLRGQELHCNKNLENV